VCGAAHTFAPHPDIFRCVPILNVRHITTYLYKRAVVLGEHRLMFRPRDNWDQRLLDTTLSITPEPSSTRWVLDVFGNCVTVVDFSGRAKELTFASTIRIVHFPVRALDFPIAAHAEHYPFSYDTEEMPDLLRSIERQYPDRNNVLYRWARQFVKTSGATNTHDMLASITQRIHTRFAYVSRKAMGIQDPLTTLELASGSCRDFAILMIEAVRSLGLAARFVSGYIHVPPGADPQYSGGGSTHAWVQVYVPGAGWMEFDPTNGIIGNCDLIRVAVARDPIQAVPIWGSFEGAPSDSLSLNVDVQITSDADRPPRGSVSSSNIPQGNA
jgi:transglutaminase-like putative cysteine protease